MKTEIDPALKKFLQEECKTGDYAALTVMVNKQHIPAFLEHFQAFQAKIAVVTKKNGVVIGMDKKKTLKVVDDDPTEH